MHLVVLEARFEEMVAASDGDVVKQLDTRVVVVDRKEERHSQAIPAAEIHSDVGKRTRPGVYAVRAEGRAARPVVGSWPIFPRVLEAELIGEVGPEIRYQTPIDRVR